MDWSTACPDWERRILARESLIPFAPLFQDQADAALDVFNSLRIVDAPGSPTMGEAARPWLQDFVGSIFGSYDEQTGRRLITEYFLLISKKNAKSTGASGIMMTALLRNWRMSGEFQIIAPTIEVANNSFFPARDMIRADPELNDLLHVQEHVRTITHRQTKATLKVVAADSDTVSGKKAIGTLIDELWLFGKRPNAENMLREAIGGLASRPEGFVIYATTQSDDPPAGVFRQKLQYARQVRDGKIADKRFLPVLYEFPDELLKDGRQKDKSYFYVTNPNLGASVDVEFLEREFDKASAAGEESLRGFLSKHLNVEIGLALRSDRWVGADHWEAAADKSITLDSILSRCEVVVGGIDGGGLDDLLGLAVLGREKGSRRWLLWSKAWAHETVLERRKSEAPRLRDLERAGDLVVVSDMEQAFSEVADILAVVDASGMLAYVGLDPMGVGAQVDALALVGIGGEDDPSPKERVVGISQGWTLNGAIKTAEIKLASGALKHAGQDLMAWAVGNAKTEPKGNAITITKAVAGTAKIDPLMAAFDAVALMSKNPPPMGGSIYETEDRSDGLLVI
ncbi:terminase large subunit [Azospirillum sp. TSO5]|uniref:terminase large subunit n=1 Tax=Azospirillum sp. TSO5 TaxID=716760 RepID=UPI000D60E17F|nr:terminase large subunit [Azospirillum sp. TSO5]PWC96956.1 terminase [Azospirillum sp. TSO5]